MRDKDCCVNDFAMIKNRDLRPKIMRTNRDLRPKIMR